MEFTQHEPDLTDKKILYRYHNYRDTAFVEKFYVVRETPCGYWIRSVDEWDEKERWVSNSTRKRFAYPTEKEALKGFIARKKRQLEFLESNIRCAKLAKTDGENKLKEIEDVESKVQENQEQPQQTS